MSKIQGAISITGLLAPNDSADTYAITDEKYNRGGYRSVANITELNSITQDRRSEGMLVNVISEDKIYKLVGGVFEEADMGGGGQTIQVSGTAPIIVENNIVSIQEATSLAPGAMSAADKLKLTSIVSFPGFGSENGKAVEGLDPRLSDARAPLSHTHSESDLITSDSIVNNATTSKHGFLPKLAGGTLLFLRSDGTWATPVDTFPLPSTHYVAAETVYGLLSNVGTSSAYARADHTHGTPMSEKDKTTITGMLKGAAGSITLATANVDFVDPAPSSVGYVIDSFDQKDVCESLDSFLFNDPTAGFARRVSFSSIISSARAILDDVYEARNNVVVNYYVSNLSELISAWNSAQAQSLPAKIYAKGDMIFGSDVSLTGTKQVQIEGVPIVNFKLNGNNFSIFSPNIKNAAFFLPNSTGYIKSSNGGASLDYAIFRGDSYEGNPFIPHIVLNGPFINSTGNVRLNDIYHNTSNSSINADPTKTIQPIYIKDNTGTVGDRLSVSIKNIDHSSSFDRFAKVLIQTNPNVVLSVTGDESWKYDASQVVGGSGLNPASILFPVSSLRDVRISGMSETSTVVDSDKVIIERNGKAYLVPKDQFGGGGDVTKAYVDEQLLLKANQSTETISDPSTGENSIADVHLAALAAIAGSAGSADYADYANSADYATYDALGNQIDTHYATQAELEAVADDTNSALDLKAMQNVGICAKCPIYPEDIIIDPVANTLTIASTKRGTPVTAENPIRFFTDGAGVINKWEKTAPVTFPVFTNTTGIWYFHFDNTGAPVTTQVAWSDFNTIATVFRFYLNATKPDATKIVKRDWEAHMNDISAADHAWKHSFGTQALRGFDVVANVLASNASGVPTSTPNSDGRNTVISLTGGTLSDDGLECTLINTTTAGTVFGQNMGNTAAASLNATNSGLFKLRINDVNGLLDFAAASRFPFFWNATNNIPEYITQTGVRTQVADNRWMVNFVYAFPDPVYGECINIMSADQEFTSYANAQAYNWPKIQSLYATARDPEVRPLYQLIHYVDRSGGGAYNVGCKYAGLVAANDIRKITTALTTTAGGTSAQAANVTFVPSGNLSATNVEQALYELDAEKQQATGLSGQQLLNLIYAGL